MFTRLTGLWRHREFVKLWAGQTVSLVGSQVTLLALPLTAALVLRATPLQMGILTAATATPALLFGLPAGAWIDRLRRRPLLVAADLGRFALLGAIPLAYLLGILRLELLYAIAFLIGTFTLLFDVAYQAFLPSLVARDDLVEGNSKLEMSRSAASLVGPGLAGALVQLATAPLALALDACSFLVSAISLGFVRAPEPQPDARDKSRPIWSAIGAGLRLVFGAPTLRALTGSRVTLTFFNSMLEAVFVLYLVRQIGIAPALLGLILTLGSLGFLVGAALAGRVTRRIGSGAALVAAPLLIGVGDLFIPLAGLVPHAAVPLLVTGESLFGLGFSVYNINQVSLRQALTPQQLQGRMNASMYVLVSGLTPLGALLGGALGQRAGFQPTLIVAAVGEALSFLWIWCSPTRGLEDAAASHLEA